MDNIQRLEQQAKKVLNKILSLFPIPKMHPKLIDMEREAEQIALLGEINTEKITPLVEPTEWVKENCKELFADIKKEDIKLYIDGKEVKGRE